MHKPQKKIVSKQKCKPKASKLPPVNQSKPRTCNTEATHAQVNRQCFPRFWGRPMPPDERNKYEQKPRNSQSKNERLTWKWVNERAAINLQNHGDAKRKNALPPVNITSICDINAIFLIIPVYIRKSKNTCTSPKSCNCLPSKKYNAIEIAKCIYVQQTYV